MVAHHYTLHVRPGVTEAHHKSRLLRWRARRWVVERTFAWLGRSRRLAKDFEKWTETSRAYISIGMIQLMVRRLAKA